MNPDDSVYEHQHSYIVIEWEYDYKEYAVPPNVTYDWIESDKVQVRRAKQVMCQTCLETKEVPQ